MNTNPIGMFDSGIGGMTVFKEVKEALANEKIIYLGDNINFPYGAKSKETIQELTQKGLSFCEEKGAKLLVIACGTATSQALEEVKDKMKVPVIGIIEPTIEYIAQKENIHTIGVMATAGTIRSGGWEKAIQAVRPDICVKSSSCPLLAPLAEEGWVDNQIARLTIREYIQEMRGVDAVILGCTHYPLFEKVLQEEFGSGVELINTGKLVAKKVKDILTQTNSLNEEKVEFINQYQIFVTDQTPSLEKMTNLIFQNEKMKEQIQKVRLS